MISQHAIRPWLWVALSLFALGASTKAFAHDPGLSSADATISATSITVTLVLNERDWRATGITTDDGIRNGCAALACNGVPLACAKSVGPTSDHIQNVSCELTFPNPGTGKLVLTALLFDRLPFGHREFVKVTGAAGEVLAEKMLKQDDATCEINLAAASPGYREAAGIGASFLSFLLLGICHILTGYDHMLFLAGLLLVCSSFRQAAGVITWFTIAHSLTLLLSTFAIVPVPSRFVEQAIAASIVYVGVENILRPGALRWRGPIAFGFGLVHGLGFAGVLRSMGIGVGHTGFVIPLIAFNGGVELAQLNVALVALPLIFALRKRPRFVRIGTPAVSLVIALLGAFWFLQRTISA